MLAFGPPFNTYCHIHPLIYTYMAMHWHDVLQKEWKEALPNRFLNLIFAAHEKINV